jgi:hypothetical protein
MASKAAGDDLITTCKTSSSSAIIKSEDDQAFEFPPQELSLFKNETQLKKLTSRLMVNLFRMKI